MYAHISFILKEPTGIIWKMSIVDVIIHPSHECLRIWSLNKKQERQNPASKNQQKFTAYVFFSWSHSEMVLIWNNLILRAFS